MDATTFFEINQITKTFPGVRALDSVSFSISSGEVRALVGENGAGKSTLMKILNGNYTKDSGKIFIRGEEVDITSPVIAAQYGISIIFQELNLIDSLTVAENIFLGRLGKKKTSIIKWDEINARTKKLFNDLNFEIDPRVEVGTLSIAQKQMVEIARALSFNSSLILMDEPSATLTNNELASLFSIVRDLKKKGVSVIYISHRLEEIYEICDSVTIMRDGCIIDTKPIGEITKDEIISKMVGRSVDDEFPVREHGIGEVVLKVSNLSRRDRDQNIEFELHRGEVLGFAGLVGSGRTEIMRALYGLDYVDTIELEVFGEQKSFRIPRDAQNAGIGFITEDRKEEGLIIDFTVRENIIVAEMKKILKNHVLNTSKATDIANKFIELLRIRTPSSDQKVENLSGGNQQKIVIAKWLNADSEIIIMDEPTRGIDVGAKHEIYQLINKMVSEGKAIILISSELPEVLALSDRILVMKGDKIVKQLSGKDMTAIQVMKYAL